MAISAGPIRAGSAAKLSRTHFAPSAARPAPGAHTHSHALVWRHQLLPARGAAARCSWRESEKKKGESARKAEGVRPDGAQEARRRRRGRCRSGGADGGRRRGGGRVRPAAPRGAGRRPAVDDDAGGGRQSRAVGGAAALQRARHREEELQPQEPLPAGLQLPDRARRRRPAGACTRRRAAPLSCPTHSPAPDGSGDPRAAQRSLPAACAPPRAGRPRRPLLSHHLPPPVF